MAREEISRLANGIYRESSLKDISLFCPYSGVAVIEGKATQIEFSQVIICKGREIDSGRYIKIDSKILTPSDQGLYEESTLSAVPRAIVNYILTLV